MTIDQTVHLIALVLFAGLVLFGLLGWSQIREANRLPYFMLRRDRIATGWRLLILGLLMGAVGLVVQFFGRPAAYMIVPPTPSSTPTPTITPTPSITPTPTITQTPSITPTPTITPTPLPTNTPTLPDQITVLFRETVTPPPDAVFSQPQVATRLGPGNQPINPQTVFIQPQGRLYASFSYNFLQDEVRWSAIWYREGEIICLETQPWDGGTGGFGFTECEPESGWIPGEYEIQMFLGETWKVSTRFTVLGGTQTPTPSSTPVELPTSTATASG